MPTTDAVNITKSGIWLTRLQKANQQYKAWSDKYRIPDLEAFYEGFQWNWAEGSTEDRYTSNRFFTAIDVKLPELTFSKPRFEVKPKPGKDEWDEEAAGNRAFLRTHVLNTIFSDPDIKADEEIQRAVQDAFFRFGVIEVGYSSDWIDNPNVMEPMYASHEDDSIGEEDDEIVKQPSKLPVNERIYLKQIPAANFRVGELHDPEIERCDWCGYWEYALRRDIVNHPNYDSSSMSVDFTTSSTTDQEVRYDSETAKLIQEYDVVIIWKIWDMRAKIKRVLLDGSGDELLSKSFERLPIQILKFRSQKKGWFPKPYTSDWRMPQIELNETREAGRAHRRRFRSKYIAAENAFAEEELDKIQSGGDGTIALTRERDARTAITPLPNADLGTHHFEMASNAEQDFDTIAGVPAERRGDVSDRTTATQSRILDARADVRSSRDRIRVANFLNSIGREVLLTAQERYTSDFWAKITAAEDPAFGDLPLRDEEWRRVTIGEFSDLDFEVNIQVSTMSPMVQQREKEALFEFLTILTQFPLVSLSPALTRDVADKVGYRNQKVLRMYQRLAQAMMLQQMQQADQIISGSNGAANGTGNAISQGIAAQNTPNDLSQIEQQITNQVGR